MSYEIGTATSYTDLLDKLNTFLAKGHSLSPIYGGGNVGNGKIDLIIGTTTSVYETITVTFTSSTAFSVSGSVSGALGTGTVGTAFTSTKVKFTITAGGTAWANLDTITFVMTAPWVAQRSVAGSEYIWKAPGNDNAGAIYVGARTFSNVAADYYNWQLGGFTGYSAGVDFGLQPGSEVNSSAVRGQVLPLWNSSMPYWFAATGRYVVIVAKVSTVYTSAILGLMNPYATPTQFPYPLIVGGSMRFSSEPASNSVSWRWSYTGVEIGAFPMSIDNNGSDSKPLKLRRPDGYWRGFTRGVVTNYSGMIWPYVDGMTDLRANIDGSYPLLPVILFEDNTTTKNIFGELPGIYATTGFGNAVENIITVGRDQYLVVQNVFRTTKTDYFAVKLF